MHTPSSQNPKIIATTIICKRGKYIVGISTLLLVTYAFIFTKNNPFTNYDQQNDPSTNASIEKNDRSTPKAMSTSSARPTPEDEACQIPVPVFADRPATALASYPGSGNTMTRVLIEALTGVWTGSTHGNPRMLGKQVRSVGNPADDRLTKNVVAVKTHQPGGKKHFGKLRWTNATRVILIIRDPLNALPSAFNAK
uniref:Sulfotransferase domain-containing protein n=1 Tax=Corethron hystrix TaxID=216773 RepID=A0A7S1BZB7_9STRA